MIENDLKHLRSHIGHEEDKNAMFKFGDKLIQKKEVGSIIPGRNDIGKPRKVEVWCFTLRK